jgi:hypothetical protein
VTVTATVIEEIAAIEVIEKIAAIEVIEATE